MAPSLTASSGSENAAARPPFSPQILNGLSLKELHLAGVAQSSTKVVTPIKLRLCKGKKEVLQGIAAGVDLFDSAYIYHLTLGGFALTFPLDGIVEKQPDAHLIDNASDMTKINLRAIVFRKDTSPILEGCNCYTCLNHTKAYINHLLNVHEMLAQILLEIHNTYHYLGFFQSIREAIKVGKFQQFHQKFVEERRNHLTLPTSALSS
uniref:tRNA-guanine(15) transglycosylase-like domain-containing protein n=1 Tax=Cucumis sativus TaxID=3659 RepID=A0A0A0LSS8_CUCSA